LLKCADALMEQCERAFVAGLPPDERAKVNFVGLKAS